MGLVQHRIDRGFARSIQAVVPGGEFLWLLLMHVLPRRFRRARDLGLLHANAKALILMVQLVFSMRLPWLPPPKEKTPIHCPRCGELMKLLAVRVPCVMPLLC